MKSMRVIFNFLYLIHKLIIKSIWRTKKIFYIFILYFIFFH